MNPMIVSIEGDIVVVAKAGWAVVEKAVVALEPQAKADLTNLINQVVADIESGKTLDELVTALLNLGEAQGMSFVIALGTDVLRGLVAALALA